MSNKRHRRNAEPEFHVYTPGVAVPRDVTHVLVPASVEVLPDGAFKDCHSLKEVVLSAGLREIGEYAFGCPLLETVKLCGGIQRIEGDAFVDSELLHHIKTPSKALLVVAQDDGIHNFHLVTNGAIPRSGLPQVVITSECFNSMSSEDMSQVELTITEILRRGSGWADKHQRLSALVAAHELRHKKEVTTLLELALWKTRMVDSDPAIPKIRGDCHINCGANDIIPNVLPFL